MGTKCLEKHTVYFVYQRWRQYARLKCWYPSLGLQGITSLKTAIFILTLGTCTGHFIEWERSPIWAPELVWILYWKGKFVPIFHWQTFTNKTENYISREQQGGFSIRCPLRSSWNSFSTLGTDGYGVPPKVMISHSRMPYDHLQQTHSIKLNSPVLLTPLHLTTSQFHPSPSLH